MVQLEQSHILATLIGYYEVDQEVDQERRTEFAAPVAVENLPFKEAIDLLKNKVDIPTSRWYDLLRDSHDVAFVVAGVTQADLLAEFHKAVDDAIKKGTTINDFRKSFDQIVQKHGWTYNGERGWRTSVIFDTNMHTARAAGRWQQFERIREGMDTEPNLRYTSVLGPNTRIAHRHLHGTIRPMNDPFWGIYYPPNGYRCQCTAIMVSDSQMQRRNWKVSEPPNLGTYDWKNPNTGKIEKVPVGITPGFDYPPGKNTQALRDMISWKGFPAGIGAKVQELYDFTYGKTND